MAALWEPIGAVAAVSGVLTPLWVPYVKRNNKRRNERKTDDIMWNGRKASRGLAEVLPMWERVENMERERISDRAEFAQLKGTVATIDQRTKQLEPDQNGGHSLVDLVRKIAEDRGIETGGDK